MTTLAQSGTDLFLNDSGLETTLVFQEGRDLPCFAAFPLLEVETERAWLRRYFDRHLVLAQQHGTGFVIDTPTWRANPDWGRELGYDQPALDRINAGAVRFCRDIARDWSGRVSPVIVNGVIGPRGDGYVAGKVTAAEAEAYHAAQIAAFAGAGADMVSAYTISTIEEAVGITRAARSAGIPVAISFTVETDGRLPSGTPLGTAIQSVDEATGNAPDHFMINCAHPTHFADVLAGRPDWVQRIRGIKANASMLSHAELEVSETLDDGDPADLGQRIDALRDLLPNLVMLGGCCGTDDRHIAAIADACCAHHPHRA